MRTRREFLGAGFGAVALGLLARSGMALGAGQPCGPFGLGPGGPDSSPLDKISAFPQSMMIDGMPFAPTMTGDWPEDVDHPPFRHITNPPKPDESVDVVVVGGGLSGLAAAYLLRDLRPVLLEFQPRFGGVARGEHWAGTSYSLGSAYFITPDKGSFLESLYTELGLNEEHRLSKGLDPVELFGEIRDDFWTGAGMPKHEVALFERYRKLVLEYAENYPEIPLTGGEDDKRVLALDKLTLKQDIEQRLGAPAPALLAAAIQAYCYSSFNAGWEELSAAAGWNFVAAEEYGRWVLPGGNAGLVERLWSRLRRVELADAGPGCMLRGGSTVHNVRLNAGGALVTYTDAAGALRSIQARRVVMACPKYVAKYLVHMLGDIDRPKFNAMHQVLHRPYVVANVLLDAPIERDFYDIFLLGDGNFPTNDSEAEKRSRVIDLLSGHFARHEKLARSVLTLYWPLPWGTGRFTLVPQSKPLEVYGAALATQVRSMLDLLAVPHNAVRQVRLTRWGHSMPLSSPTLISGGVCELMRRPVNDTIYFVQQDNWALPAVEVCLLEAETWCAALRDSL